MNSKTETDLEIAREAQYLYARVLLGTCGSAEETRSLITLLESLINYGPAVRELALHQIFGLQDEQGHEIVKANGAKALELLAKAWELGDEEALYWQGFCFHQGERLNNGPKTSLIKALEYYNQAREKSIPQAFNALAQWYEQGCEEIGIYQNPFMAQALYTDAMRLGSVAAKLKLIQLYSYGIKDIIPCDHAAVEKLSMSVLTHSLKDLDKCVAFFHKMLIEASTLQDINQVHRDLAQKILLAAAARGHAFAHYSLAILYNVENRTYDLKPDYRKAIMHASMAVKLGYSKGLGFLARLHQKEGRSLTQAHRFRSNRVQKSEENYKAAFMYFKAAVAQHCPESLFFLAQCYEYGLGTQPDLNEALSLYTKFQANIKTGDSNTHQKMHEIISRVQAKKNQPLAELIPQSVSITPADDRAIIMPSVTVSASRQDRPKIDAERTATSSIKASGLDFRVLASPEGVSNLRLAPLKYVPRKTPSNMPISASNAASNPAISDQGKKIYEQGQKIEAQAKTLIQLLAAEECYREAIKQEYFLACDALSSVLEKIKEMQEGMKQTTMSRKQ